MSVDMAAEMVYRLAFLGLLIALLVMRGYFMVKVRRSGEHLMPGRQAVEREGGPLALVFRVILFFALVAFLVMYFSGAAWIDAFSFHLPAGLRWLGFALGILAVAFWTWTQIHLDTRWSAQLQLTRDHDLVSTGPYRFIRHPLYTSMFGWCLALPLLTANWIILAFCLLSTAGILWRVPKEEKMMLESFGSEYQDYVQHTGRFFPKI